MSAILFIEKDALMTMSLLAVVTKALTLYADNDQHAIADKGGVLAMPAIKATIIAAHSAF